MIWIVIQKRIKNDYPDGSKADGVCRNCLSAMNSEPESILEVVRLRLLQMNMLSVI